MIDTLLVAIDGSEHSLKAVDQAGELAAALNAKVIVLNVVKPQELPKGLGEYAHLEHLQGYDADILRQVGDALVSNATLKLKGAGVSDIEPLVQDGPIARTIVACAKLHKADMIIVGTRGMGNIEATLRGGVSHRVELLAKCPVLTVR